MANIDGSVAEIEMYGDIVETRPVSWWGDGEVPGDFIVQDEFLEDLESVISGGCKKLIIHMNSYGGDAGVSILIHNRIRELAKSGVETECIVDGVAMSGGSLIMCACDNVKVHPSCLVMIHKAWSFLFGGYNADEMRNAARQNDAWDKAQLEIYKRKTGLSDTVIMHMMADTTTMTGKEATEKGFANELIDDAEPLNIAASANGKSIFVKGREVKLWPGVYAPDFIPTVETADAAKTNIKNSAQTENSEGGTETMPNANTLVQDNAGVATPQTAVDTAGIANAAADSERERLRGIDEVAHLFDDALVEEAKYGETRCDARELCHRAAVNASKAGRQFMASIASDIAESGAQEVSAAPDAKDESSEANAPEKTKMANARSSVKSLLGKTE